MVDRAGVKKAVCSGGGIKIAVVVVWDGAELGVCGRREWELWPSGAELDGLRVEGRRFGTRLAEAPVVVETKGGRVWTNQGLVARLV